MRIASISLYSYPDKKNRVKRIFTHEQALAFQKSGVEIEVFDIDCNRDIYSDYDIEDFEGIKVHRIKPPVVRNWRSFIRTIFSPIAIIKIIKFKYYIRNYMKENTFDAILLNFLLPQYLMYLKDFSITNPQICLTAHGTDAAAKWDGFLAGWMKNILLRKCDLIFPVSEYTDILLSHTIKRNSKNNKNIIINYNGVNEDKFVNAEKLGKTKCRDELGIENEKFVLLTICDLVERKGVDILLKALGELKDNGFSNFLHIIIGKGSEGEKLTKLVNELEIQDNIRFIDYLPSDDNIGIYYKAADIYSMISKTIYEPTFETEGFGISYIEASYLGLPVIGGSHGGSTTAVKHGFTGYLVDPNKKNCPTIIANYIKTLHDDKNEYSRISDNGKRMVREEFLWSHHVQRFKKPLLISKNTLLIDR
jgi:glycosyltransferase involved in cell wall biosynthesis